MGYGFGNELFSNGDVESFQRNERQNPVYRLLEEAPAATNGQERLGRLPAAQWPEPRPTSPCQDQAVNFRSRDALHKLAQLSVLEGTFRRTAHLFRRSGISPDVANDSSIAHAA